jgi:hypothetical protein
MSAQQSNSLTPFVYRGPTSGLTLVVEDGSALETMLFDGEIVSLPAENEHVKTLVAQDFLTPVEAKEDPGASGESTQQLARNRRAAPDQKTTETNS